MALKFTYHCTNYRKLQGVKPTDVRMTQTHGAARSSQALCNVHFSPVPRSCHWAPGTDEGWQRMALPREEPEAVKGSPLP